MNGSTGSETMRSGRAGWLFLLLTGFLLFSGFYADAAPAKKMRSVWLSGRRYVYLQDIASYFGYRFHSNPKLKRYALYDRTDYAVFTANRRAGKINGTAIVYLFPPTFYKGNPVIAEMDLFKTVLPLIKDSALPKMKIRTVMIDAGHGGKDTGAPGPGGRWEKAITLSIAMKLREKLRRMGFRVLMTRTADVYPSLEQRTVIAARWKPDLFVSIHCNAAADRSIDGVETFAVTPVGAPSSADSKPGYNHTLGNNHDSRNTRLAYEVQRALLRNARAEDRGIKHARFYVVKKVNAPAVLVETGFLSNRAEGNRLTNASYQDKIASGIAEGIRNFKKVSERR